MNVKVRWLKHGFLFPNGQSARRSPGDEDVIPRADAVTLVRMKRIEIIDNDGGDERTDVPPPAIPEHLDPDDFDEDVDDDLEDDLVTDAEDDCGCKDN